MIDLNQYRSRIGSFHLSNRCSKNVRFYKYANYCTASSKTGRAAFLTLCTVVRLSLLAALILSNNVATASAIVSPTCDSPLSLTRSWSSPPAVSRTTWSGPPEFLNLPQCKGKKLSSNFCARYLFGNIQKGIRNLHLNIRSLSNKVSELKKIVKEHSPHILGLSETELNRNSKNFDETKLKIQGYQLLFPKSWFLNNTARVVVYVKKSLQVEQLHDLEDPIVQSVWLRAGFKNGKKLYYCHGYREHTSSLGNTLSAQRSNLNVFLQQWEMATEHNSPADTNEVHVAADMNLDALDGRWLEPGYSLLSLSRMVQNICNSYNFSQLVKEATRVQFNSTQNSTNISCIDHIYTNAKFRCSNVTVTPFGDSDHDIVSYTRYSREPREPARTVRKRSYKDFSEEKYLQDLAKVDWSDVLTSVDVDLAAELLTRKIRYCLNVHAPWVIFQQRKFFSPWLTDGTKKMMMQRDRLKQEAKDLAIRDKERGVTSDEQISAWAKYRKIRNKINNNKRDEENNYKAFKINQDVNCPAKAWTKAKVFMGWKSNGTPCQLEIDGVLVTKAATIANKINDFFINKVETIRKGLKRVPEKLDECFRIMQGKNCKLSLSYVTVNAVTKLLKNLKNSKCTSIDELDSYAIKLSAELIAEPLHHVITLSMMQSRFPSCWKYTKLTPNIRSFPS